MTRPGPKPTPAEVLKLRGSYREDRHGGGVELPDDTPNAGPPDDLPPDALQVWEHFSPLLLPHGLLKATDAAAFEMFVSEYARWRRLEKQTAETGGEIVVIGGVPKQNPVAKAAQQAREAAMRLAREFGMTPAARRGFGTGVPSRTQIKSSTRESTMEDVLRVAEHRRDGDE